LEQKLLSAGQRYNGVKSDFFQAVSVFEQLQLATPDLQAAVTDGEAASEALQRGLEQRPVDVVEVDQRLAAFETLVSGFGQQVALLAKEKEEADRELRRREIEEENRRRRSGGGMGGGLGGGLGGGGGRSGGGRSSGGSGWGGGGGGRSSGSSGWGGGSKGGGRSSGSSKW
jgi:hypothetical protein